MYYEEKIVDGVLSHRGTPTGKWIPFTPSQLTQMVIALQKHIAID